MLSTKELKGKYFKSEDHPYRIYEKMIRSIVQSDHTILDAGCGRTMPVLRNFIGKAQTLIGVDLEENTDSAPGLQYIQANLDNISQVKDHTVDIVISRSVFEHVENPLAVFKEVDRMLKPGGHFIFLTPNLWDYVSLFSHLIPNQFHGWIVKQMQGRETEDTFPTFYRANTLSAIKKLSKKVGFQLTNVEWRGQPPSYFMFNSFLYILATYYEKCISSTELLRFLRGWLLVHITKTAPGSK